MPFAADHNRNLTNAYQFLVIFDDKPANEFRDGYQRPPTLKSLIILSRESSI
jgi:hypothetical protein